MKTLNNSIIAAVLTLGSFTITHAQETERKGWDGTIKGGKTETTTATENRGVEKKDIKRTSSINQNPLYEENNKEGVNPLHESQQKGISEGGLKKNDIDASKIEHSGDPHEYLNGKTKGKIVKAGNNGMITVSEENPETPTVRKGWDGSVKGGKTETQRKAIKEGGLKKNEADIDTSSSEKKGLNAVNVKLSRSNTEQSTDVIDNENSVPQGHAVKTKGTGGNTDDEAKPVKVEQVKLGQPHP